MELNDNIRLSHIKDACLELVQLTASINDLNQFLSNRLYQHSSVRLLEIIGEACGALSANFKEQNPNIDWQAWKDMRNILIHQYFGVDYKRVYLVIQDELPELVNEVQRLLIEP